MKTAVITGGSGGIGKAIATGLAVRQYRVIIHGKDVAKTANASEEIKQKTGNASVEFITADISTKRGMKELAEAIRQKTDVIHSLVLSTGVILPNYLLTEDGLEMGFVIQYLSRFAVTQLLMQELVKGHAKIVMVGAPVIRGAHIFFEDLALKNNFTMVRAMAQEMFANHLFVQEFAKRNPDNHVVMNMAYPGITNTGIFRYSNIILRMGARLIGKSPEAASKNFIYLAGDDAVNFSGYFLKRPGNHNIKEKINYDASAAERLWNKSLELIGPILYNEHTRVCESNTTSDVRYIPIKFEK